MSSCGRVVGMEQMETPLMVAAKRGSTVSVRCLLQRDAKIDVLDRAVRIYSVGVVRVGVSAHEKRRPCCNCRVCCCGCRRFCPVVWFSIGPDHTHIRGLDRPRVRDPCKKDGAKHTRSSDKSSDDRDNIFFTGINALVTFPPMSPSKHSSPREMCLCFALVFPPLHSTASGVLRSCTQFSPRVK